MVGGNLVQQYSRLPDILTTVAEVSPTLTIGLEFGLLIRVKSFMLMISRFGMKAQNGSQNPVGSTALLVATLSVVALNKNP
jgi:hypothetical protein